MTIIESDGDGVGIIDVGMIRIEKRYGRIRWLKQTDDKLVLQQEIMEIFQNKHSTIKWVDVLIEENESQ